MAPEPAGRPAAAAVVREKGHSVRTHPSAGDTRTSGLALERAFLRDSCSFTQQFQLGRSLPTLLAAARAKLPLLGLGLVREETPGESVVVWFGPFGLTGCQVPTEALPEPARPSASEYAEVAGGALEGNRGGLLEGLLLTT